MNHEVTDQPEPSPSYSNPNKVFLTRKDLRDLGITVSPSTLIRWQNAGRFPKAVRLGGSSLAWPRDQVMQWCSDRIKEAEDFQYADF